MLSQAFISQPSVHPPPFFIPYSLSPSNLSDDMSLGLIPQYPKKAGKWTFEEDDLLRKYVGMYGEKQWRKISQHIPGRTSIQCLHRWSKILRPGLVKGPWTPEEDEKLVAWVNTEGANKWAQAASFIVGRSGKQCRERWFNNLNPEVKKGEWAKEEDELIFELYKEHGSSWSKIAKFVQGRTENSIKNRFYSTLRKISGDKRKVKSKSSPSVDDETEDSSSKSSEEVESAQQPQSALYKLLQDNMHLLDVEKEEDTEEVSQKSPLSKDCKSLNESTEMNQQIRRENSSPIVLQAMRENSTQMMRSGPLFRFNGDKVLIGRDGSILRRNSEGNVDFEVEDKAQQQCDQKIMFGASTRFSNNPLYGEIPTKKPENLFLPSLLQQRLSQSCNGNMENFKPSFNFPSSDLQIPSLSISQGKRPTVSRQESCDLSNPIEIKLEDSPQLTIPEHCRSLFSRKLEPLRIPEGFKLNTLPSANLMLNQMQPGVSPINVKRLSSSTDLSEKLSMGLPIGVVKRHFKENFDSSFGFGSMLRTRKEVSQDSHSTQVSDCEMNEFSGHVTETGKLNELMLALSQVQNNTYPDLMKVSHGIHQRDRSEMEKIQLLNHLVSLQSFLKNVNAQQQQHLLRQNLPIESFLPMQNFNYQNKLDEAKIRLEIPDLNENHEIRNLNIPMLIQRPDVDTPIKKIKLH